MPSVSGIEENSARRKSFSTGVVQSPIDARAAGLLDPEAWVRPLNSGDGCA